ncbi:MAG TPA: PAS domain S-box protein [Kofleriaceae bacterium]|nr:PAS domain S-box protein [Kofleriaceae bacterium]
MSRPRRVHVLAVVAALTTVELSHIVHALAGTPPLAIELLLPVALAAYLGGFSPGVLATALVAAGGIALGLAAEAVAMLALIGSLMSWLCGRLRAEHRASDVSERRFSALFEKLFEVSPLPMTLVREADDVVMEINAATLVASGYAREDVVGRAVPFATAVQREADAVMRREVAATGRMRDQELQLRTLTGDVREVLRSVERIEIDGTGYLLAVYEDVTDRNRMVAALRDSEERFRDVTEAIREVFWLTDPTKQEMLYISPAYEAIWGRSCASLLAKPTDWLDAVHRDDRARVEAAAHRQVEAIYDEQYRIVRPDGAIRAIRDRAFPVRDASGAVVRIAGLAEDITERVQLEQEVRQAQKLESIGLLAGGVAHDFNNILAVIASCSGMLGDALPAGSEDRALVDDIDGAVTRATGLTRQLLAFSRRQVVEPIVLDLNTCVNETQRMLRRMVGEDIVITTSLDPELGRVRADRGYIVQVLMNLIVNARDAMPKGGMIDLTTRNVVLDASYAVTHPSARPGAHVMLAVRDTGCGMSAEVMSRIFEPFFTTKELGHGTGMGLSVVRGIVEQAGGHIDVASELDVGTTFRIYLPVTTARDHHDTATASAPALGVETVLFVDDDDHVRRAVARGLRTRGFTVIEAGNGAKALELLAANQDIALLVTDVVMPGMDGRELVEATQAERPGLPALYTSGYTDDAVVRHGVLHGQVELIEKPYRVETLAAKIRQMLDRDMRSAA